MTTAEAMTRIGRLANWKHNGLTVTVEVRDYKCSYGCDNWLITPVDGSGSAWVQDLTWRIGE